MRVNFLPYREGIEKDLEFAVIAAQHRDKWIFCRHRERDTWEIPGGHREEGESILQTAKRELWEETGAKDAAIIPLCVYRTEDGERNRLGGLFYAEADELQALPGYEIAEVRLTDGLPDQLTYPQIQPALFERAGRFADISVRPALIGDAAAIWQINTQALGYPYAREDAAKRLAETLGREDHCIFAAESGGEAVGYLHLADYVCTYSDPLLNILALAVLPDYQHAGFGRKLVFAGEKWAMRQGFAGIRLVSGKARTGAHRFYESCGYTFGKMQKNYRKLF